MGRDVKFTIDQSGVPGSNNVINVIEILYPNGTDLFYTIGDVAQSFSKTFDFLEVTNCLFIYFVLNMYLNLLNLFYPHLARLLSIQYSGRWGIGLCSCYN